MKAILVSAIVIIMCITSLGIYGMLSGYAEHNTSQLNGITAQTEILNNKKQAIQTEIVAMNEDKKSKEDEITNLKNSILASSFWEVNISLISGLSLFSISNSQKTIFL